MAVKKVKQPGVGTQGPTKKPARDDPSREKEHGQQQADEVLLKIPEQPSVTKQREREACADVPEDVPQSENVDEKGSGESRELLPKVQEGRALCMHGRTPKSQLSSSGMQKRKVQNMMVRTSSK